MLSNSLPSVPNNCIVYTTSGVLCGRPGVAIDHRRGGMICQWYLEAWTRLNQRTGHERT